MIMDRIYRLSTYAFDPLHHFVEGERTNRAVGGVLIAVFLGALAGVELKRHGLLPEAIAPWFHNSHFWAVNMAFTLVLVLEVVSLIFTIPCSISKSVGKQFEILGLILLRSTFKELTNFPEPITIADNMDSLYHIVSDGLGALAIFALLGIYYRIQKGRGEIRSGQMLYKFVASKKLLALVLLALFTGMGLYNLSLIAQGGHHYDFFAAFYTVLVFSDVLVVLISQRHLPRFHAVFRNSGFALATLLIRLALTAPPYVNALIGVGAIVYALLLTLAYNAFYLVKRDAKYEPER